jgi:5-methylcytosine-specific restriction endonuclease McrA
MKNLSQDGWSQESKDSWLSKIQDTYRIKSQNTPFDKLGKEKRRQRVFTEQNFCCNKCKLDKWLGQPIHLELEHIDGDNTNNSRTNLEGLCPNCHSQTLTYKNRNCAKGTIYSDTDIIDALKNNVSGYAAMKQLGMNPHGGHYIRFRNIIKKYKLVLGYTI